MLQLNWKEAVQRTRGQRDAINVVDSDTTAMDNVLARYADTVFSEEVGTFKFFKGHVNVKKDATPVFRKARPVSYALRDTVEVELDRLEKEDIIKKRQNSTWLSPVVNVPKPGNNVRICSDYKIFMNPYVEIDPYPLPTAQDLFATLAGGHFTKLDLRQAYHRLELDDESKEYLVINTHKGLYTYERLSFGVSTAPSQFQKVIDQTLQSLEAVWCYLHGQCSNRIKDEGREPSYHRSS